MRFYQYTIIIGVHDSSVVGVVVTVTVVAVAAMVADLGSCRCTVGIVATFRKIRTRLRCQYPIRIMSIVSL
jgi:hypothetical protein